MWVKNDWWLHGSHPTGGWKTREGLPGADLTGEQRTQLLLPKLVMTNSLPWYRWSIEIGGVYPLNRVDFPWRTVSHNQMVIIVMIPCINGHILTNDSMFLPLAGAVESGGTLEGLGAALERGHWRTPWGCEVWRGWTINEWFNPP